MAKRSPLTSYDESYLGCRSRNPGHHWTLQSYGPWEQGKRGESIFLWVCDICEGEKDTFLRKSGEYARSPRYRRKKAYSFSKGFKVSMQDLRQEFVRRYTTT